MLKGKIVIKMHNFLTKMIFLNYVSKLIILKWDLLCLLLYKSSTNVYSMGSCHKLFNITLVHDFFCLFLCLLATYTDQFCTEKNGKYN